MSLTPQRGILIAVQGSALGSSDISEKALKGRTNLQVPGLVARGLKPPCQPPACLQHARNKSASTWGWKPQAIDLRAFSTPISGDTRGSWRAGTSRKRTRVWTMNRVARISNDSTANGRQWTRMRGQSIEKSVGFYSRSFAVNKWPQSQLGSGRVRAGVGERMAGRHGFEP